MEALVDTRCDPDGLPNEDDWTAVRVDKQNDKRVGAGGVMVEPFSSLRFYNRYATEFHRKSRTRKWGGLSVQQSAKTIPRTLTR